MHSKLLNITGGGAFDIPAVCLFYFINIILLVLVYPGASIR